MVDLYRLEYMAACAMLDAHHDDCDRGVEGTPRASVWNAMEAFFVVCETESKRRKCRLCGCTEDAPCTMISGAVSASIELEDQQEITCGWVEDDLCSFCHSTMFRDHEIKTSRGDAIRAMLPEISLSGGGMGFSGGLGELEATHT